MIKAIKAKRCGFRRGLWKFFQAIKRGWQLGYLKILLCLIIFVLLSILKYWAELDCTIAWKKEHPNFWWTLLNGLTDPNTLSVFTGAIITILIWQFSQIFATLNEERRKTNQDQHAMIRHYSAYAPERDENGLESGQQNAVGHFMDLRQVHRPFGGQSPENHFYPTNRVPVARSAEFFQQEKANEVFMAGRLFLPSVNLFTNKEGNVTPVFADENTLHETDPFISGNMTAIFAAHTHSATKNSITVRLAKEPKLEGSQLILGTSRTTYFDMLMTNRCMDFDFGNGLTLRNLFEKQAKALPFENSPLANQIGINGMIITNDGWLLLEKRSLKKSTWKGKYAQPISLSMQVDKLGFYPGQKTIEATVEGSNEVISHLIRHTIRDNYGLLVYDYDELKSKRRLKENEALQKANRPLKPKFESDAENYQEDEHYYFDGTIHFLGLARDLLEGGKPNLYYYVILDLGHEKLAEHLRNLKYRQAKPKVDSEMKLDKEYYRSDTCLPLEKLQSGYIIAKYDDVAFDMDYKLSFRSKKVEKVRPIHRSPIHPLACRKRGCGEALLVTMSYLEEVGGVKTLLEREKKLHPIIVTEAAEQRMKNGK